MPTEADRRAVLQCCSYWPHAHAVFITLSLWNSYSLVYPPSLLYNLLSDTSTKCLMDCEFHIFCYQATPQKDFLCPTRPLRVRLKCHYGFHVRGRKTGWLSSWGRKLFSAGFFLTRWFITFHKPNNIYHLTLTNLYSNMMNNLDCSKYFSDSHLITELLGKSNEVSCKKKLKPGKLKEWGGKSPINLKNTNIILRVRVSYLVSCCSVSP